MRLVDWLNKPGNKVTQDALGREVGVTQGRISQIARNGTRDFPIMKRISRATGYEVTVDELLPAAELGAEASNGRSRRAAGEIDA